MKERKKKKKKKKKSKKQRQASFCVARLESSLIERMRGGERERERELPHEALTVSIEQHRFTFYEKEKKEK